MADGDFYDEVDLGSGIWLKSCRRCGALVRDPRFTSTNSAQGVKDHDAWHGRMDKVMALLSEMVKEELGRITMDIDAWLDDVKPKA